MSDLISRQAAIDALDQIFDRCEEIEIEAHLPEGDPDRTGYKMYPDYMTVWKYLHQLPSAQPEQRWIPVSERLPKIADVYRVTRYYPNNVMNPNYLVDACFFDGSNTWYNDNRINHERYYANNVIAWQENPEPYEPQERSEKE